MSNIFEIATEFVDYDNRKFRMIHNKTSSEVLQNKFEVFCFIVKYTFIDRLNMYNVI